MKLSKLKLDSIGLLLISLIFALIAAEIFIRLYDGYSITSLSIPLSKSAVGEKAIVKPKADKNVSPEIESYLGSIPLASSVELNWIYQSPELLPNYKRPQADTLKRIVEAPPQHQYESNYVWNYYYLEKKICRKSKYRDYWKNYFFYRPNHRIYAYKPRVKSIYPVYRFLPGIVEPSGMVINNVGFRGHNLSIIKPKDTIRLVFLGSSTTINRYDSTYSYPELVEYWLNLWARKTDFPYRIEVINAARSGISSPDIAKVMLNEALPLNPDYVFYYEGSNQFTPGNFLDYKRKKYR